MLRRATLSAAAAASVLTLVAACGGSSSGGGSNQSSAAPKVEFTSALHALTSGSALTTTLSLDTTGANILAIGAQGDSSGGGPTLAQANLIAGAHLAIETLAPKGKNLNQSTPSGESISVTGGSGSTTYFSLRSLGGNIYVQLDLKDILAAAGESSEYQTLVLRMSTAAPFIGAFVAGKWVLVSVQTITSLEALLQVGSKGQVPSNSALSGLSNTILATVLGDLTVARTSTGSTDHLAVTANIRTIAESVVAAIAKAIPAAAAIESSGASSAPDKFVAADAYVTDGALSKAVFNIDQFAPMKEPPLSFVATFARSGDPITVPAGATEVKFADLVSLFESFAGTSSSSSSSGSGTAAPAPVKKHHK
jgi:hypothetical protein